MFKIPVFVSAPSDLNKKQKESYSVILEELKVQHFEPRAIGRSDYPVNLPLQEVYSLAKHCAGGLILGFSQFETKFGLWKKGTRKSTKQTANKAFPTPWNQLESGILFGLKVPLLVFREKTITGGIFDPGVTDVFIHNMPIPSMDKNDRYGLRQLFLKWARMVRDNYYSQSK